MQRDSFSQTLLVAGVLCVVCSVLVASAAVGLRSKQETNKRLDQKKNVLLAANLFDEDKSTAADIDRVFEERIQRELIELDTGKPVPTSVLDPASFDQREAARDPEMSEVIEPTALGGIKSRAKYAFVYKVKGDSGKLDQVVLPIYGKGLWSTLYGFISIDSDGKTVRGITFYEHGETPGLGGEVDNTNWKALWAGKQLYGEDGIGEVELHVIKGAVNESAPDAEYLIDGLSGATITSNGVTKTIQYWLGPGGFAPYLKQLTGQTGGTSRG